MMMHIKAIDCKINSKNEKWKAGWLNGIEKKNLLRQNVW